VEQKSPVCRKQDFFVVVFACLLDFFLLFCQVKEIRKNGLKDS
jgi:hypothetical protein